MTRLRIAIHSDLREHGDQATVYRETLGLFARAEELGIETAWVRSYKFRRASGTPGFSFPGGLPSPLVFLAALAARTSRIRLGTAVVPLPLENVVRVAEDAAVVDALSDGRLELGVSNGGRPPIAAALGISLETEPDRKKASYLRSLDAQIARYAKSEPTRTVARHARIPHQASRQQHLLHGLSLRDEFRGRSPS